jgi:SAM-dependent methyltransferase
MKLTVAAENPLERVALALGVAPIALMETHLSFLRARAIMVATKLGVFDALADAPSDAAAVAARCGIAPHPTGKLLNALVGCGYLAFARGTYRLTWRARTWLTSGSPRSVRDKVLFEFIEWALVERMEDYLRDGQPIEIHAAESDEQWALYQRAMRAISALGAGEVVRRTPVPRGATRMLDIGGSHGYLSSAMCRRYAGLTAVVFDLPAAVKHAAPILAREGMGSRVVHHGGDALRDDLGSAEWDIVFVSLLVHHFDEASNRALLQRIARALRPGGVCVILELIRPPSPNDAGQVGALLDLYYALTSASGTWSVEEMTRWQIDAGLTPRKPIHLRTTPGAAEIIARKRA